jgi:hypothetical protein
LSYGNINEIIKERATAITSYWFGYALSVVSILNTALKE